MNHIFSLVHILNWSNKVSPFLIDRVTIVDPVLLVADIEMAYPHTNTRQRNTNIERLSWHTGAGQMRTIRLRTRQCGISCSSPYRHWLWCTLYSEQKRFWIARHRHTTKKVPSLASERRALANAVTSLASVGSPGAKCCTIASHRINRTCDMTAIDASQTGEL